MAAYTEQAGQSIKTHVLNVTRRLAWESWIEVELQVELGVGTL
jgi:hypothetical protein